MKQCTWNGRFYNVMPITHRIKEGSVGVYVLAEASSTISMNYKPLAYGKSEDLANDLNPLIDYLNESNLHGTIQIHYMGVPLDRARALAIQEFEQNYPHLLQLDDQNELLNNPKALCLLLQMPKNQQPI